MPEMPAPAVPGQPQSQPPPFGQSAATQPTPNRGFEAAGLQQVGSIVKQLEDALPKVGASSELGETILKCLSMLVKHVKPGTTSPASEKGNLEQQMMRATQQNQAMQALRAQQAGGGQPQQGAQPPRAA